MSNAETRPFEPQTLLGRTGLRVGRLGVSAGYGIGEEGMELALEARQNLFYWGSLRRGEFGRALAKFARRDRRSVAIALQSYARTGGIVRRSVERALRNLSIDFADILILGYWPGPPPRRIFDAALDLKARGLVRFLCVSCHNLPAFKDLMEAKEIDILMARYNAAHRGAETALFPHATALGGARPGIAAFTATRWGDLLDPKKTPKEERTPDAADCYRFALSQPCVDVCLCGPKNAAQMRSALDALRRGAMSEEELAWMERVGTHVAAKHSKPLYERF